MLDKHPILFTIGVKNFEEELLESYGEYKDMKLPIVKLRSLD